MSNSRLKELLAAIHEEMDRADADRETRAMLKTLDADIHELLGEDARESGDGPILEQAKHLEARFATTHPAAERFMREVIDTLVKMGL
jgi:hypothetical protein